MLCISTITMDEQASIAVGEPNADERLYRQTAALNNEVLISKNMQSPVVSYSQSMVIHDTEWPY